MYETKKRIDQRVQTPKRMKKKNKEKYKETATHNK